MARPNKKRQKVEQWLLGIGEVLFNGYGVSVWDEKKVLEVDGTDVCATRQMYLISLHYTLKNG